MLPLFAFLAATTAPYGTTSGGAAVDRITLTNASGSRVAILTYGGVIDEISVPDTAGRRANVVLAVPLATHEAKPNFGSIVGRVANRISGGGFTLDGTRYPLSSDPTAIVSHGGTPGFGARIWRAEPCRRPRCAAVTLHYTSPDGENGFPGTMRVSVTYTLTPDDAFRIDYRATTDKPTPFNPTNHSHFNLAGSGTILGQRLHVAATRITGQDARKVPTGSYLGVAGTAFDLRRPVTLGDRLTAPALAAAGGFDHNFVLDGSGKRPRLVASLEDPASGRTMRVLTTEPGMQVYTTNSMNGSLIDKDGRPLVRHAGVALETQHFPDSPNRPEFPSVILRPGETFRSTTIYAFGVRPVR